MKDVRVKDVLVTGASGQLGGFVVDRLQATHAVRTLDRMPSRTTRLPHHRVDILDADAVTAATEGVNTVVHLAALDAAVDATERAFFEVNVQGTWNVLEAAERAGVTRVILCSSVAAVGIAHGAAPDYLPIDEAHPCRPTHAYGLSKQVVETLGRCFARRGQLEVVCLRPAFVLFPSVAVSVAAALSEEDGTSWSLTLPATAPAPGEPLTPTRAFVGPNDAASCFALAVDAPLDDRFKVFFVTSPWSMSNTSSVDRARALGGQTPRVQLPELYEKTPHASMFTAERARTDLGWLPKETFEDVLTAALGERQ